MRNKSVRDIPKHLRNTFRLIRAAFPDGLDKTTYFPLLFVLYDDMSDRNLAEVVSKYIGKDYSTVLNDIYRVVSTDKPASEDVTEVKRKLLRCGYDTWRNEEQLEASEPAAGKSNVKLLTRVH